MDMGRGEERVSCLERATWKLTSPYIKWIAVYFRKLKQGPRINLERWEGVSEGKGYMYTYG